MKFLVTGAAGFIGFHVCRRLLTLGYQVIGLDNLNDYYDVNLKLMRLAQLTDQATFQFIKLDITDSPGISALFAEHQFQRVIHLAAQAGVRYSLENPLAYIHANLVGYINVLEGCRYHNVEHLLYASSSSVYGLNRKLPFSTADRVDHPVSLYAATKKSNELMSHTYSHLYGLPTTGLRFFTVYGPWGRPDMALFKFTKAMLAGDYIDVYNNGQMQRDFTYIDDIIETIMRLQNIIPGKNPSWTVEQGTVASSSAPYHIYNIGNSHPATLMEYIHSLEVALGISAKKNMMPLQLGDLLDTSADLGNLYQVIGFVPRTTIMDGVKYFVEWYKAFYKCP